MLKLCVAGAAGRMGNAIINEATLKGHQVVGAIELQIIHAQAKLCESLASPIRTRKFLVPTD